MIMIYAFPHSHDLTLQAIKLLGVEKGKKGKTNLVFVAGQRVLDYLGRCYDTEKALTASLK